MTDATCAGVCDTRSAINWIEDVREDNDSLVTRSFFLHNELDGGEKRPLGRRKRRGKKNPTHIKAVDSHGEMSEKEPDPPPQMRTHCQMRLMRCMRAARVENTASGGRNTSRGVRPNPLHFV